MPFDRRRQVKEDNPPTRTGNRPRTGQRAEPNLNDGRRHVAYKPEYAVDLESGVIVSAVIHPADQGDTTTPATTFDDTQAKLCAVRDKEGAPGIDEPFALVADKGHHSRGVLQALPIPAAAGSMSRNTRDN